MRLSFTALVSSLLFSCGVAFACQPPPANYFEFGNIGAVIENAEVSEKMGKHLISGIQRISETSYLVLSSNCQLEVTVDAKQMNPGLPCGGPFTFTANVVGDLVCSEN